MSSGKPDPRPYRSGFCNRSNPPDSHTRCLGGTDAVPGGVWRPCCCTCHQQPEPEPVTAVDADDADHELEQAVILALAGANAPLRPEDPPYPASLTPCARAAIAAVRRWDTEHGSTP